MGNKITEIVSPTLDQGQPSFRRNTSSVGFTLVDHNINEPVVKKRSFFGKILQAAGAFAPLGLFFGPPGWIAGAAVAGAAKLGANSAAKASQSGVAPAVSSPASYPGFSPVGSDPMLAMVSDARDNAFQTKIHEEMR